MPTRALHPQPGALDAGTDTSQQGRAAVLVAAARKGVAMGIIGLLVVLILVIIVLRALA